MTHHTGTLNYAVDNLFNILKGTGDFVIYDLTWSYEYKKFISNQFIKCIEPNRSCSVCINWQKGIQKNKIDTAKIYSYRKLHVGQGEDHWILKWGLGRIIK